jgi:dipeptidyl aminopeptidase/acylaminoacyl peptidase
MVVGQRTVDVSPDGRTLAFGVVDRQKGLDLFVCALPACTNRRRILAPTIASDSRVRWKPDGSAFAYIPSGRSAANLWIMPLDGAVPYQFTHFRDDYLASDFAWSRDGQRLAIARGKRTSDLVLFRGLRRRPGS